MTHRPQLFLPWLLLATVCSALMYLAPGDETVPYHIAWIGVALAYGFDPWPLLRTLAALVGYTCVTGGILVLRAATGVIAWEETAEIPLMAALVLLAVWHVRRRQAAMGQLMRMAARDQVRAQQRERLSRVTSHEMRTPLTIAVGYVDLLLEREKDEEGRADLEVVRDELGRLSRASDRLLRMIALQDLVRWGPVDVDRFLREVGERWATVADRQWVVDTTVGTCDVSAERLRACMDTLIENALRYTVVGDVVRLCAIRSRDSVLLGVADSGSGLSDPLVAAVNAQDFQGARQLSEHTSGSGSQTGLGLGLVHEMVSMCGGTVVAGTSAEGGALVLMALPQQVLRAVHPRAQTRFEVTHPLTV
jgi:two-component system, OmpR family, sensor kinase